MLCLAISSCKRVVNLSHDPKVVDSITMAYIISDFKNDLLAADENIGSIEEVATTRQDYIPIALVYYTTKDGKQQTDFYFFDYKDLSVVRDLMEQNPDITTSEIATKLSIPPLQATAMYNIITRAANMKK